MRVELINDRTPLTHRVTHFCEIRIPEEETDYFEDNPADLGRLVMAQFNQCAVVVLGVVYEEE